MTKLTLVGEKRKRAGRDRVATRNKEWLEWARFHARQISMWTGRVTTDDIHELCTTFNRMPTHHNAFGAIFRGKQWECTGFEKSVRPSAHARPIGVWRHRGDGQ
jgi:hypothetical protein